MEAKEMEKEGGNSSASKSWTPAEEAAIASVQETTGCTRMQAIQRMRAGISIVKHPKEMPLTDKQNKVLDQFEDYGIVRLTRASATPGWHLVRYATTQSLSGVRIAFSLRTLI